MAPSPARSPYRASPLSRTSPLPSRTPYSSPPTMPSDAPLSSTAAAATQPASVATPGTTSVTSSSSSRDTVRVAVRVRPLNAREKSLATESKLSWQVDSKSITQASSGRPVPSNAYVFDNVFHPPATNSNIFDTVAKPVVSSAVEGINAVIFAYGQTAAGKTHTMLGSPTDAGVTPRAISAVFEHVAATPSRQFLLRATYIEIYNEVIRDLLVPANDNLKIHEDTINKRVFVDAKEVVVSSVDHVMQIIAAGEEVRAVGETNMNDRSSRSHTIFSLKIESREFNAADAAKLARRQQQQQQRRESGGTTDDESMTTEEEDAANDGVAFRSSTLSLVDLAGSERASFTKAQGLRLVEGGHINKSLLTLGTVINKLSSGESRSLSHIPYRDSKLTRLLQPALGGNARTAILCAVTPSVLHMDETLSTLKFASRAKKVTNSAKTNEFLDDRAKLRRAEKVIAQLRAQLRDQANGLPTLPMPTGVSPQRPPSKARRSCTGVPRGSFRAPDVPSPGRRQAFERKFDQMLEALAAAPPPQNVSSPTPPRRRQAPPTPSALSALHLMDVAGRKRRRVDSSRYDAPCAGDDDEKAELRRRTFRAERRLKQALTNIEYERQDMNAEVRLLVTTAEEASAQRAMAEREADNACHLLACATAASMVDEMVSEAMATSHLRGKLATVQNQLSGMRAVQQESSDVKSRLSALQREHAEMARRERRGIGPVLKQSKAAQAKLADAEAKLKAAKANLQKIGAEKSSLERELKERERRLRVIQAEVDRHRSHNEKAQMRVNKEFKLKVEAAEAEQRKKLETAAHNEIESLTTKLRATADAHSTALAQTAQKIAGLKEELSTARKSEDELREMVRRVTAEREAIKAELNAMKAERDDVLVHFTQHTAEAERLRADVSSSEETVKRLHKEISDLAGREQAVLLSKGQLKQDFQRAAAEAQAATEALSVQRGKIDELTDALQSATENGERLLADMNKAREAEAAALTGLSKAKLEVEDARTEAARSTAELAEVRRCGKQLLEELRSEVNGLKVELEAASREMDGLRETLQKESSGRTQAEDRTAEVQRVLELVRDEEARLKKQVTSLEGRANEAERLAETQTTKVSELEKAMAEQRELLSAAESKSRRFEEQMGALEKRLASSSNKGTVPVAGVTRAGIIIASDGDENKRTGTEWDSDVERRRLTREVASVLDELRTRTRELQRLSETIRARDAQIFELEEKLRDMANGQMARLEERVRRRDDVISGLTKRMERLKLLYNENIGGGKEFEERWAAVERVAAVEAENDAMAEERRILKKRVESLEQEQRNIWQETMRLRDVIKQRDGERIAQAVQRQEQRLDELAKADGKPLADGCARLNKEARQARDGEVLVKSVREMSMSKDLTSTSDTRPPGRR